MTLLGTWGDVAGRPDEMRVAEAAVAAYLYGELLNFLTMWSQDIATFVLSLLQIVRDIRLFVMVLLIVLTMFVHVFSVLLRDEELLDRRLQARPSGGGGASGAGGRTFGPTDTLEEASSPFDSLWNAGVTLYLMMLGSFDRSLFRPTDECPRRALYPKE